MDSESHDAFLRSINIVYDADMPASVSHFYPTAKSIPLLESITGETDERAFFVIAPYGSGKSLTATYALHLIENRKEAIAHLIDPAERIDNFSPSFTDFAKKRLRAKAKRKNGVVIAIHGSVRNLPETVKESAISSMKRIGLSGIDAFKNAPCSTMEELAIFIPMLVKLSHSKNIDRVAFIWDEFGKHLETLIERGRTSELLDLQQLAEYVSRQRSIPVTLTIMMHQGLTRYASNLPQSARGEWNKVSGRFRDIQYVDTSKEIYTLISRIIKAKRVQEASVHTKKNAAKTYKSLGLFNDFSESELQQLLEDSEPLDPVALHLLPRISARVAQNERTLFSFLYEFVEAESISSADLYDYFSNEMYADVSVGGASKQWLQTQSALSKCDGSTGAVVALKSACLLGMGLAGERTHASKELLIKAVSGVVSVTRAKAAIQELFGSKLLLHREHTNSVTVWHGTDFDLRGKVEDIKGMIRGEFDLIEFLNKEAPPRSWKPLKYNATYGINRYFHSSYANLAGLPEVISSRERPEDEVGYYDAKLIYFIPSNDDDIGQARSFLSKQQDLLIGVVIPKMVIAVFESALEVHCLLDLSTDHKFLALDPLLPAEVDQMLDDARHNLHRLINRLVTPSDEVEYFFSGKSEQYHSAGELQERLSSIMKLKYNKTPVIQNELIVRRTVSKPMQNARKKLVMGILEQAGDRSEFGYTPTEIKTPQASMYRSVLINTGLYDPKRMRFAKPQELEDKGLRAVWDKLETFMTIADDNPFDELLEELQQPPYGVRPGLVPVLISAAYKQFTKSKTVLLKRDEFYLEDVLPSHIEDLCIEPSRYTLKVISSSRNALGYLESLAMLFRYGDDVEDEDLLKPVSKTKELLRQVYEAFEKWKSELPRPALTVGAVSEEAMSFRKLLRTYYAPDELFYDALPDAMGCRKTEYKKILIRLKSVIHELTNIVSEYQNRAEMMMRHLFAVDQQSLGMSLLKISQEWAACFPVELKTQIPDLVARRLFMLIEEYQDVDERLVDDIALILVGRPVIQWESATYIRFEDKLTELVSRLNRNLIEGAIGTNDPQALKVTKAQIESLCEKLCGIAGEKGATKLLSEILELKSWQR